MIRLKPELWLMQFVVFNMNISNHKKIPCFTKLNIL